MERPEDMAEAERLKLVTLADRKRILEMLQTIADNARLTEADRQQARTRVDALARLLRMKPPKKG